MSSENSQEILSLSVFINLLKLICCLLKVYQPGSCEFIACVAFFAVGNGFQVVGEKIYDKGRRGETVYSIQVRH